MGDSIQLAHAVEPHVERLVEGMAGGSERVRSDHVVVVVGEHPHAPRGGGGGLKESAYLEGHGLGETAEVCNALI